MPTLHNIIFRKMCVFSININIVLFPVEFYLLTYIMTHTIITSTEKYIHVDNIHTYLCNVGTYIYMSIKERLII